MGRAAVPAPLHYALGCIACIAGLAGMMSPSIASAETSQPASLEAVAQDGDILVSIPILPGGRWCLGWNHSVEGFEVLDCYGYLNGRMVLERSHQPDFAAGLGHISGRGEQVSDGHGGYWINHIDEPVPNDRYVLRVGSTEVNHRILWGTQRFSLSAAAAHERVIMRLYKPDDV